MSEEIALALADMAHWRQRAEQAEALTLTLQAQRNAAEAETAQALIALNVAREALDAIDRHVIGACSSAFGMPEPCEECGEMREIASQALKAIKRKGK